MLIIEASLASAEVSAGAVAKAEQNDKLYAVDRNGPVCCYSENVWEKVVNISYDWSVSDIKLNFT